jgi:antitoxin (DNA-binding transcriptional repressor) of toxin-antitoxin stability system
MEQIGARELRHRLREYLARADGGERFEVTLFGRPVAYLGPTSTDRTILARLIDEGRITPAANPDTSSLPSPIAITTGVSATDALLAERRGDAR